jgi:hypothetical protein
VVSRTIPRTRLVLAGAAALVAVALSPACRGAAPEAAAPLAITLATPSDAPHAVVELTGLTRAERTALAAQPRSGAEWEQLFRVAVARPSTTSAIPPAVAGRYAITDRGVRFTPAFPLSPGRAFDVTVDLPRIRAGQPPLLTTVVTPAASPVTSSTRVVGLSPSAATLPENLLRLYIWFSAPMGGGPGASHVTLIDEERGEVRDAFLPVVDGGFWNHDFTRYTLFFDPGRVKEGVLRSGRPLMAGRRYRIRIAASWRDANGAPLAETFEHRFTAGPAQTAARDIDAWRIGSVAAGTRDVLTIAAPAPLDRAIALRAIGVTRADGTALDGDVALDATDMRWQFTPREPWTAGAYRVVALDTLEDPAGNRIGRAFEVPIDDRAAPPAPRLSRTFTVVPPT